MALFIVTAKRNVRANGEYVEEGMSVEVVTKDGSDPMHNCKGQELVADAFMRKYGVDLHNAHCLTPMTLESERIN